MNAVPNWWLTVSAILMVANAVMFVALAILGFRLAKFLREVQPKVASTLTKVESIADETQKTLKVLSEKARTTATSAEIVAKGAASSIEKLSPVVGYVLTALRVFGAIRQFQSRTRKRREAHTVRSEKPAN